MRRIVAAVALLVVVTGCHDSSKLATVKTYQFADSSGAVRSKVTRTILQDGSEILHGETIADFLPNVAVTERVEEDVHLDASGKLVTAEVQVWNTLGTTEQKKYVMMDAAAGTIHVTRPAGSVDWTVATDLPWAYYPFQVDTFVGVPVSSPVAGWVMAKSEDVADHTRFLVYDDLLAVDVPNGGPGTATLYAAGDAIHIGADFIDSIDMAALGTTLSRATAEVTTFDAFTAASGTATVTVDPCTLPGTAEAFAVTSSDGTMIKGEFDLPSAAGPYHFVVFNAGTGGADRDEAVGGIPRWRCLAKPLLDAGIAVARYDDRGHGESGGTVANATFVQRSQDAAAVAALAAARTDLDPGHLFLLGHSEGVAHVSDAAVAVPEVDGLILFSGVGSNGEAVVLRQEHDLLANYGFPQSFIDQSVAANKQVFDSVIAGTYTQPTLGGYTTEFWKEFLVFDGGTKAAAAARPTVIFQGTADWQVAAHNADLLAAAISSAGVLDVTEHVDVGDGHFESHAPDNYPNVGDEYWIPIPWNPALVSELIAWLESH